MSYPKNKEMSIAAVMVPMIIFFALGGIFALVGLIYLVSSNGVAPMLITAAVLGVLALVSILFGIILSAKLKKRRRHNLELRKNSPKANGNFVGNVRVQSSQNGDSSREEVVIARAVSNSFGAENVQVIIDNGVVNVCFDGSVAKINRLTSIRSTLESLIRSIGGGHHSLAPRVRMVNQVFFFTSLPISKSGYFAGRYPIYNENGLVRDVKGNLLNDSSTEPCFASDFNGTYCWIDLNCREYWINYGIGDTRHNVPNISQNGDTAYLNFGIGSSKSNGNQNEAEADEEDYDEDEDEDETDDDGEDDDSSNVEFRIAVTKDRYSFCELVKNNVDKLPVLEADTEWAFDGGRCVEKRDYSGKLLGSEIWFEFLTEKKRSGIDTCVICVKFEDMSGEEINEIWPVLKSLVGGYLVDSEYEDFKKAVEEEAGKLQKKHKFDYAEAVRQAQEAEAKRQREEAHLWELPNPFPAEEDEKLSKLDDIDFLTELIERVDNLKKDGHKAWIPFLAAYRAICFRMKEMGLTEQAKWEPTKQVIGQGLDGIYNQKGGQYWLNFYCNMMRGTLLKMITDIS